MNSAYGTTYDECKRRVVESIRKMTYSKRSFVIGISSVSGGGKTATAKKLVALLHDAAQRIKSLLLDGRSRHNLRIRALTARSTEQAYLNEVLQTYTGTLEVELQVTDLNALSPALMDPRWPEEQANTVQAIIERCREKEFQITVWRYPYSPSLVGRMVDQNHLIMAFYVWDKHAGTLGEDDFVSHDQEIANDYKDMVPELVPSIKDERIYNLAVRHGKSNPHHGAGYLIHPIVADAVADWL